jgi:amino acid transporter
VGAVVQSAALAAPSLGLVAGFVFLVSLAGVSSPFAMLVGTLICLAIASIVSDFARRLPSVGSAYVYLANAIGARTGFVAGSSLLLAYLCMLPFQAAFLGTFFSDYLATQGVHISWVVWAILLMAVSTTLAVLGIMPSMRVGLIALAFEVTIFLVLGVAIVVQGGAHGLSLEPFDPARAPGGVHGSLLAIVFGIFTFAGFESATTLGEEARDPSRTIPRALMISMLVLGVFYVFMVYAGVIGYGTGKAGVEAMTTATVPFPDLANRYVGPWLGTLITVDVVVGITGLNIVSVNAAARMFFAMGRDKMLPRVFASTNARSAPHVAAVVVGVGSLVATLVLGLIWGPGNISTWTSYLLTLLFIVVYGLLTVGLPVFIWRSHRVEFNVWRHVIVPVVSLAGLGLVTWGNTYPLPPSPLRYLVYATVATTIGFAGVAAWLRRYRRDLLDEAGHLFSEEVV